MVKWKYFLIFVNKKINKIVMGNTLSKLKKNTFRRINPFNYKSFFL